jgi:hypothetical protein
MEQTQTFDVQAAIAAQRKLCDEKKWPHFAPSNGICYKCRRQIYSPVERQVGFTSGVSVEQASTELVTGCPHCYMSYCD